MVEKNNSKFRAFLLHEIPFSEQVTSTSDHFQELFTNFILFLDNMKKSPCAAASPRGASFANILSGLLFPLNDVLVLPLLAVSLRALVLSLHCLPCP